MYEYFAMVKQRPEKFKVTEGAFSRLLNFLSIEECREVIYLLNKRIDMMQKMEEENTAPVEKLALSPRIINILKANKLHTIEDMTEFGLERIKLLRGIGDQTYRDICKVYFQTIRQNA
jgi:DNA-directed RNA polymerase alpha subunit